MSELQRGLLPLFFGQLLFQSFLFCLTLLYPFRDPFRRLTLFQCDPKILNGQIRLLDGLSQLF